MKKQRFNKNMSCIFFVLFVITFIWVEINPNARYITFLFTGVKRWIIPIVMWVIFVYFFLKIIKKQ